MPLAPVVDIDDDFNLYTYVGNDPLNKMDPSGLTCVGNTPNEAACHVDYFNGQKIADARADGKISAAMEKNIARFEGNYTKAYAKALSYGDKEITIGAIGASGRIQPRTFSGNQIAEKMRDGRANAETRTGIAPSGRPYQSKPNSLGYTLGIWRVQERQMRRSLNWEKRCIQ